VFQNRSAAGQIAPVQPKSSGDCVARANLILREDEMGGRIIHYGVDEHYRLRSLRNAGYTVDSCSSLSEFKWVLYSGSRADAVAFTEATGQAPRAAMSLARNKKSPLVLFQGWTPHYEESDFNLVVPMLTTPEEWLSDIASLIARTRRLVEDMTKLRVKSRTLCDEVAVLREQTTLEVRRAVGEKERNQGFKVDFLNLENDLPDLANASESSAFLRALGNDAMQEFRSLMTRTTYPPGSVLFGQGQLPSEILLILKGSIKLSVNSSGGKRFIVHIAAPGEMLGLASAFTSSAYEVTAETLYPCDVGSVNSSAFVSFLDKHPLAFRAAARELGYSYNRACTRLRTMGLSLTVMAKIAGLLLEWSKQEWSKPGEETKRDAQIHLALTHEEIGQCIGTTRESVTRVMQELQRRKIIDQRRSVLRILNRRALEACAGEL
jgi:CRP/FNR family transcriptional regulator